MKPLQLRRPRTEIERKRPTAEDHLRLGEKTVAFLAGSRARASLLQVACRCEGGPGFTNFTIVPTAGVGQADRPIDRLDLQSVRSAEALNCQNVDSLHRRFPKSLAETEL